MHFKVNLLEPVAALDWGTFRVEGDSYLRRLGVPDETAIWLAAKLYLSNWQAWKTGRAWDAVRGIWLKKNAWQGRRGLQVLDPRTGQMVPPCMAPAICDDCGDYCSWNALRCRQCWDKIRPRRDRRGSE